MSYKSFPNKMVVHQTVTISENGVPSGDSVPSYDTGCETKIDL